MLGVNHVSVRMTRLGFALSKMFQNSTSLFVILRQLMMRTLKFPGEGVLLTGMGGFSSFGEEQAEGNPILGLVTLQSAFSVDPLLVRKDESELT